MVGEFKNQGREWHPAGRPPKVNTYDFPSMADGKAVPYGVYDIAQNTGFVSVGIDRDTSQFSVAAISAWWQQLGLKRHPHATSLTITADCGGSNGNRTRLWKTELQRLADESGLQITVCHFPPGTSKWNKIEHRLFSFISKNWRGRPLASYQVIIDSITATKTDTGLEVFARLDENEYPKIEVTDAELAAVNISRHTFLRALSRRYVRLRRNCVSALRSIHLGEAIETFGQAENHPETEYDDGYRDEA